ncbi:response regulator [Mongoliitalea daihaiensis]|uniref:response regulator n=1 Tax=Mongoliitalea daihaiensis TaxID=2782006 RepID=UPI001F2063FA|nr:response regulator transcription factor [Mongoliitalea daihaiensis]UJP66233.1 response regulator transcription factor [Mongoliitalea daihaiensis]
MIRIAIADDHKLFAKGIKSLLEEEEDFKIKGIFFTGNELATFAQQKSIDIALTDMNMPGLDGIGVIKAIKEVSTKIKVIVLSMYDDPLIFDKCIKAGASAYMLKDSDTDELIYTIREVYEGSYIADYRKILNEIENSTFPDFFSDKFRLSKRELQIIKKIRDGKTNREIADDLALSQHTVETHRKKIHAKLGVSSVAELVNKANEMRL